MKPNRRRFRRRRPQSNIVKKEFDGAKIRCKADPNSVTQNPWNQITLLFDAVNDAQLNVDELNTVLLETLGMNLAEGQVMNIRIREARIWELSGKAIRAKFFDLSQDNVNSVLAIHTDSPGRNQWARVAYVWPRDHQNQVHRSGDISNIFRVDVNGTEAQILAHVNIMWRAAPTFEPPPPSLFSRHTDFLSSESGFPHHASSCESELDDETGDL